MIPMRSRQASAKWCSLASCPSRSLLCRAVRRIDVLGIYQNNSSQIANSVISIANLVRDRPRLVDVVSAGDPTSVFANPCISNAGVISTLRISSEPSAIRKASPLAAGFNVFDISHRSNSTNTVDSPMLMENTKDANLCAERCLIPPQLARGLNESLLNTGSASFCRISLDRSGYSRNCATSTATTSVRKKGIDEKMIVDGGTESRRRCRETGVQSSQSAVGSILLARLPRRGFHGIHYCYQASIEVHIGGAEGREDRTAHPCFI
jgi:hypothetical protein